MRLRRDIKGFPDRVSEFIPSLIIVVILTTLFGCAAKDPMGRRIGDHGPFDTVPWAWKDYSNRVWLRVAGVGLSTDGDKDLRSVRFYYSPRSGKSEEEAIAIQSFNKFTGRYAEYFLLRVLFGAADSSIEPSERMTGSKAFHIYTLTNKAGETNTVFFDGTMYHNLF